MLAGQARNRRAQLDGLHLFQRQVFQARLGQAAGAKAEEQRALRPLVAERAEQHGARIVVFQPARIADAHTALLHLVAEFQVAVATLLDDADHAEGIHFLDYQALVAHRRTLWLTCATRIPHSEQKRKDNRPDRPG
ncbi:hypothetical protein D3C76_1204830 [compost metagenome]